jgi:hypothetical protein
MRALISTLVLLFLAGCASLPGSPYTAASRQTGTAMTDRSGTDVAAKKDSSAVRARGLTVDVLGRSAGNL